MTSIPKQICLPARRRRTCKSSTLFVKEKGKPLSFSFAPRPRVDEMDPMTFKVAELVRLMTTDEDQLHVATMALRSSTDTNIYQTTVGNAFRNVSTKKKFDDLMTKSKK